MSAAGQWLGIATVYVVAARAGLLLASVLGSVSPVWPATGVAIGMLLVAGWRCWPGIAAGALLANFISPVPWHVALAFAAGSTLEALLGAWLARRVERRRWFVRNGVSSLAILTSAMLAPLVSASVGVAALWFSGEVSLQSGRGLWVTWWLGGMLGTLGVTPLIQAVRNEWRTRPGWNPRVAGQVLLLSGLVAGVCWLAFSGEGRVGFLFVFFPLLLLATAWFGPAGSCGVAVTTVAAGLVAVANGSGPFAAGGAYPGMLPLQCFVGGVFLVALVLPQFFKKGAVWMPALVLLTGWLLGGWMFSSLVGAAERIDRGHFQALVDDATDKVAALTSSYEDALRAGVAYVGASQRISRQEWASVAREIRREDRYPGMLGFGIIDVVPPDGVEALVERMRAGGVPDFVVKMVPDSGVFAPAATGGTAHYVIVICEPHDENLQAIGLDIASEQNRKMAADQARDSGRPWMTKRIQLVQDSKPRAGALMFAPLYRKGAHLETVEERREACTGWVYAPIILELMLKNVLRRHSAELHLRVFEGCSTEARHVVSDTAGARDAGKLIESKTEVVLGGQIYTLGWVRASGFKRADRSASIWAGFGAAVASMLLALLVSNLQSAGLSARAMVLEGTAELEATNSLLQREVGERLRAENSLRATNQIQQGILNSANYTIISTTPIGIITTFNAAAERLLGYQAAEVVGKLTPMIIHDRYEVLARAEELAREYGTPVTPGFECFVAKARVTGIEEREWTYIRKDGSRFPVLLSVTTLRDDQGEIVGFLGIGHDLTSRKEGESRVQRALDELAQQKFALDQHAIVAVTEVDGTITYVNDKFCAISGYTREEVLGKTHRILKSGLHTDTFYRELYDTIARGDVWQGELCNRAKNGALYWEESTIVPFLGPDGKPTQYIAIRADITARKHLEESLARARDDALAASRLKSEFLATMSHEIRTPMNGIIGMAGLLTQSPLESKQREMADLIAYSARNLLNIINDILDFSKIEAGKFRIDAADFNLRDAIEETVALLAPQASRKDLQLVCDISPALATGVTGDRGRLQQVLTNLLGNSIKFTERGEVRLTAQAIENPDARVKFRIEVEDTGIGIPDAAKPLLFQPFVQADGSTTRKFGGTGLGLAISSQLVALMGGHIDFESVEGSGSHFWFTLSLPHVELPQTEVLPPLPPGTRILVVDDHELSRTILHRQLLSFGASVDGAVDAAEALSLLQGAAGQEDRHSVVLLDWNLPDESALRLARSVRSDPALAQVQIVVLSSATDNAAQFVESLGLQAVLAKPVREVQLHRSLLRLHGMRETASPFLRRPSLSGRGLKILMAEDNTTNQIVAQMMIEQLGHQVAIANNGEEAIELAGQERHDVILMDCQMPVLDGYETTRRIRSGRAPGVNPRIPIVALTAYAMPGDRMKALDAGMDDYITKPFEAEMLNAALSRCGLLKAVATSATSRLPLPLPVPAENRPARPLAFESGRREQLQKMKSASGVSVWEKAIEIFMKEMPGRMQQLARHMTARDSAQLVALAHTIVGSAANLGGSQLRVAAADLEAAAKDNDWASIQTAMAAVELAWADICDELRPSS